jgi:hypothetical protein
MAKMMLEQETGAKPTHGIVDPELAASASCWEEEDEDDHESQCRPDVPTDVSQMYNLHLHDALRLLQVYHECVGVLHPIVDLALLVQLCETLWRSSHGLTLVQSTDPGSTGDQAHLYMVLAIALLAEGGGSDATATKIYNDLQPAIANQMLARNFTVRGQILLLLAVSAFKHLTLHD